MKVAMFVRTISWTGLWCPKKRQIDGSMLDSVS